MKNSNPSYLRINRLDYKNRKDHNGFAMLPAACSFEAITDINEIESIIVGHFYSIEERNKVTTFFPKSYKAGSIHGYDFDEATHTSDFENPFYGVYFKFNTFWCNEVTGIKNEAAILRREKVIKKIKEYLSTLK